MKLLFENWKNYITEVDQTQTDTEKVSIVLPKFRISERWGEPGTDDRQLIELFTSKIQGGSFEQKIDSLQEFVAECDERCASQKDVAEILGSLVFLDSLASVVYDFNDKTGGFLFESIVAALLGGSARQIPTPGGPNQPLEDLLDAEDKPVSLKFLFAGPKYIKGSTRNANRAIEKYKQPIKYIVATKNRTHKTGEVLSIDFYSFTVGNKNYPGDMSYDRLGSTWNGIYLPHLSSYHIGTLNLGSRAKIAEIAQRYADRLGDVMLDIYRQIEQLSLNVNTYFASSPEEKSAALKARENASILKTKTEEL